MTAKNDGGRKPKGRADAPKYIPRKDLEIRANRDDIDAVGRAFAESVTGGPFAALRIIRASDTAAGYEADLDVPAMIATLREQGEAVNGGNLAQAEAMLMNQATALQTVFARLVERGMGCSEIPAFEVNLRIGLRAQAQCRATLETLAAIKNPSSLAFVRQANIAHGPQQVNNDTAAARAGENEISPTQLSEAGNELLPDARTPGLAGRVNQELEAVEAINRAKDTGR